MTTLALRPFTRDDFGFLLGAIGSADELLAWAGPDPVWPLDEAQLEAYLAQGVDDPRRIRTLTGDLDGAPVAHAQLRIQPDHGTGHITRVVVAPERRGLGLGGALMTAIATLAFDELGLHRLGLFVYTGNHAAVAAYERVGFVREGLMRDVARSSEGYWSAYPMALFAESFRPG